MKRLVNYKNIIVFHLAALLVAAGVYFARMMDAEVIRMVIGVLVFSLLLQVLVYRFKPGWYSDKIKDHPATNI